MPVAVPIPLPPPPRTQKMKPNVSSPVNGDSAPVTSITNGHVLHTDDLTSNLTKRGAANGHANGNGYVSHNEDSQTDVPDGAVTSALKRSTVHATIDWEIPRKVFHSSIGSVSPYNVHTSELIATPMLRVFHSPVVLPPTRPPLHYPGSCNLPRYRRDSRLYSSAKRLIRAALRKITWPAYA